MIVCLYPAYSCMRYGKTILKDGKPAQAPPMRECEGYNRLESVGESWGDVSGAQRSGYSTTTSWLPTDVRVSEDGSDVKLLSYINNVHPLHQKGLEHVLTATLSQFIPMFEKLLGDLRNYTIDTVLGDKQSELDRSDIPINPKTGEPIESWDEDEEGIEGPTAWERWIQTAPYIDPKPGKYTAESRILGDGYSLKGKNIQVIVKVAEM